MMKISRPIAIGAVAIFAFPIAAACASTMAPVQPNTPAPSAPADDLKAFPAATSGQTRHVIRLPEIADENMVKVELIVGQTKTIDCNNHSFGGALEERTAEGWGYNYYVLENLGPGVTTLMGCPAGSERQAFVRSSAEKLVRYNSRLPLVVYAPTDVEVRYRLWRAGEEQTAG